ncbi:MAG: hypothetical protein Q4E22_00335 [Coriobacteriia bacterium]|nr:hypothetical protein [Coriobacteriia bacterium]
MSKTNTYLADYLLLETKTEEQSTRLASNESMIGSLLSLKALEDGRYEVFTESGNSIGFVKAKNKLSFKDGFDSFELKQFILSLVYYVNEEKRFHGEIAYQMYDAPKDAEQELLAFKHFFETSKQMILEGKRPILTINAQQHKKIVALDGKIDINQGAALPTFERGEVIFKRKRTLADKLIVNLVSSKPQDRIKTYLVVLFVLVILVAFVIALMRVL